MQAETLAKLDIKESRQRVVKLALMRQHYVGTPHAPTSARKACVEATAERSDISAFPDTVRLAFGELALSEFRL